MKRTLLLAGALLTSSVHANQPLDGYLLADQACPALHSIRKQTNPDQLFLEPGKSYAVKAINKAGGTHYLIDIGGQNKQQRWVATECGQLTTTPSGPVATPASTRPINRQNFLLAVSWQPSFCQAHQQKIECASQTASRFDATHLSLHGLWPQPIDNAYCGVDIINKTIDRRSSWHLLPPLKISDALKKELDIAMPGTASQLHLHEWYKHGSCYGNPEVYFKDSLHLMHQLNSSPVRELFAANIGRPLQAKQIRTAFDEAFGAGSGNKVNVRCSGNLITELWINLQGAVASNTISELINHAPAAGQSDCTEGLVDLAGF